MEYTGRLRLQLFVPGQGDDTAFVEGVLKRLLGEDYLEQADSPRLRRLYYESHTLAVADLRRRIDRTDDDAPVRVPMEEKKVRILRLRSRLPGLDITGVMEPSHRLIDSLAQQLESGQLRYTPWSTCTTRHQEINGIAKSNDQAGRIVEDSAGSCASLQSSR